MSAILTFGETGEPRWELVFLLGAVVVVITLVRFVRTRHPLYICQSVALAIVAGGLGLYLWTDR